MHNNHTNAWDPDAVAPPMHGGVYEREREAGDLIGRLARYAFLLALVAFVVFLYQL